MRKAILMMLLAGVSSSAAAEWVAIAGDKTIEVSYVDPPTIRKKGNMVKMWSLHDFRTAQVLDNGKPYMSIRAQAEFDCKEERIRALFSSSYSGNMGGGKLVDSEAGPSKWEPVAPGTMGESLWNFACGKR